MKPRIFSMFVFVLAGLAALGLACFFAPATSMAAKNTVPVNITADSMSYSPSGKEVVFKGNVKVTREGVVITAARITIHLSGDAEQGPGVAAMDPGAIRRIVATGGVRINYQGKSGSCAVATYHVREGLLVMEGDPVLQEGKNRITGHTIKFNLKENRSEVLAGKGQRVNATFQAPENLK